MGILDEAIREHLELKRQHGADESELKQLEDSAFGPPERPGSEPEADSLAEAPTEFMAQPGSPDASGEQDEPAGEGSPREQAAARIADLQEAPSADEPVADESPAATDERPPGAPVEEEPVAEAAPPEPSGPTTEERQAIAEQPTE